MLYIIATPIGNMGDISRRVVETLEKVEILLCEDTRVTGNLLRLLEIKNKPKLFSFYDEVEEQKLPQVMAWLEEGREVGLVSDAGTPLISDPGWKLIKRCQDNGVEYTSLPGPCAIINALVLSGMPIDRFVFLGFLPKREGKKRELLEKFKDDGLTKVAYESPFRVKELLELIKEINSMAKIKVVREMTKKFESVEGSAGDDHRGECVVVWR